MTGTDIKDKLYKFIKNNVNITGIKEIVLNNQVPAFSPALIIKYPDIIPNIEGNIRDLKYQFECFLIDRVTLNFDSLYETLYEIEEDIRNEIDKNPTLNDNDIYLTEVSNTEKGQLTYRVNNLTYEFIGLRIIITIYIWEVI